MSTPDTIYAKQYGNNVFLKAQQEGSRQRNTVMVKTGVKAEETYMDQLDAFDALAKGGRLSQTDPTAISVTRRRIALEDYYIAKGLDKSDNIRTLADPTSPTAKNASNGMGRKIDDLIIAAATGTAYTGKTGTTAVTFPAGNIIAAGGVGMTLLKWLQGLEILNGNDVDPSDEKFLIISSKQLTNLLNTTEIKSADYNSVKALVQGEINTFLGCKVIRSERLEVNGSNARKVLLYCKSGIGLAIGEDVTSRIDELPTNHYAKQIYFSMSMGASRLEEEKVVEIDCVES